MIKRCHIEGEAAECEEELASVSQYCSELMALSSVGCHTGSERPVQAFFKTHTSLSNGNDVYTFLSINSFHSLMNVDQRHVFCSEGLLSLHALILSHILMLHHKLEKKEAWLFSTPSYI